MINIAITGHRPDAFFVSHYEINTVKIIVDNIIWKLKNEYKDNVNFNLGGAIGIDQWVGSACINNNAKFKLYLPFHPKIQAKYWTSEQRKELDLQLSKASGIDIMEPNPEAKYDILRYFERDKKMVDNASFIIAFWVGKRRGGTYKTIKYGLSQSKFVFNGLDNLRPIFSDDLKKGWTPPTVK